MSRHLRNGCLAVAVTLLLTRVASANPDLSDFSDVVSVPEPATLLLVTVGAGAFALWRMSRR